MPLTLDDLFAEGTAPAGGKSLTLDDLFSPQQPQEVEAPAPDPLAEQYASAYQEIGARVDPADYGPMKDVLDQDEFGNVMADPAQYEQLTPESRAAVNARITEANQGAGSLQQGYTKFFEDAANPDSPDNFMYGKVKDQATTRAAYQAISGLGQQLKETYQRYTGDSKAANATNRAGQAMRGSMNELGGSGLERNVRGAAESTLKSLYAGSAGGLKGIIAWATQGAYNDAKTQAIDSGMDESSAMKYAAAQGAIEGGVTAFFQMLGFGGTEKLLAGSAKWQGVKSMLQGIAGEMGEEQTISLAQMTLEKLSGVDPTQLTGEQLTQVISDTAAQTALGFGMAQGISAATEFASKPWPSRKAAKEAGVDQVATNAKERHDLAEKARNVLTGQQFTEQVRAAATTPDEADALLEIYKARASSAGESFDDYVGKRIKGVEKTTKAEAAALTSGKTRPDGRRGEIEFLNEGPAIIRAFETQSIGTLAHETGHLFRRDLAGEDLKLAERWAGARNGKWNRKAEEKFARGFERYLATGEAPTTKLANVFAKFKDWLTGIYGAIKGTAIDVNISPEMRGVFDRLLTPEAMKPRKQSRNTKFTVNGKEVDLYAEREQRQAVEAEAGNTANILSQDLADRFRGLANQTAIPEARQANYEADVAMGFPERKTWAEAEERAAQRIQADPTGELARVVERIDQADSVGGVINLENQEETALVNRLSDMLAMDLGNPESRVLHRKLRFAFRAARSDQARALGYRDPLAVMDPEQRKRKSITDAIAEPTPEETEARKKARTPEEHAEVDRAMEDRYNRAKEALAKQGIDIDDIDSIVADPKKAMVVLDHLRAQAKWGDQAYEYWRNAILSGTGTHVANLTGNAAFAAYNLTVERSAEAFVNLFARNKRAASFGEFKYLAGGILPGVLRGLKNARTSWSLETSGLAEELGRDGAFKVDGPRGAIKGKIGRFVRAFGYRPLLFADELAKSITVTMEVGARAYRAGKALDLKGDELTEFIAQQVDDLGSFAWTEAVSKSNQLTFQGPHGVVADKVAGGVDLVRKIPKIGKYIGAFRDTPAAIFEEGFKRLPLLGAAIEYGNARQQGKNMIDAGMTPAIARQLIAMGGLAIIWDAVGGDEPWITGAANLSNDKMRDVGYRAQPPQSIRFGDTWISYARIEPFATMIATTADVAKGIQDGDYRRGFTGLLQQVKNKSFLDATGDAIDAGQGFLEGDFSAGEKWANKFAASWIPNLYRQTVSSSEDSMPENRIWGDDGDRVARFFRRTGQAMQLPFVDTQPRYDIWGKPITYSDAGYGPATSFVLRMISPARTKDVSDVQAADIALLRWNEKNPQNQKVYREVNKYIKLEDEYGKKTITQHLTDEQHAEYAQLAGEWAADNVANLAFDPYEPTADDIAKIRKAITDARKQARETLIPTWTFD